MAPAGLGLSLFLLQSSCCPRYLDQEELARPKLGTKGRGKHHTTRRSHLQLLCGSIVVSHMSEERETGRPSSHPVGWAQGPIRLLWPPELCRLCRPWLLRSQGGAGLLLPAALLREDGGQRT